MADHQGTRREITEPGVPKPLLGEHERFVPRIREELRHMNPEKDSADSVLEMLFGLGQSHGVEPRIPSRHSRKPRQKSDDENKVAKYRVSHVRWSTGLPD
jgi:hypothetical protein